MLPLVTATNQGAASPVDQSATTSPEHPHSTMDNSPKSRPPSACGCAKTNDTTTNEETRLRGGADIPIRPIVNHTAKFCGHTSAGCSTNKGDVACVLYTVSSATGFYANRSDRKPKPFIYGKFARKDNVRPGKPEISKNRIGTTVNDSAIYHTKNERFNREEATPSVLNYRLIAKHLKTATPTKRAKLLQAIRWVGRGGVAFYCN